MNGHHLLEGKVVVITAAAGTGIGGAAARRCLEEGAQVAISDHADDVIADLGATGSLTPGLNWYRANIPPESWVAPPPVLPPVQAPTMGIWSTADVALTETQMTDSAKNMAGPWRYERLDGPGHWMQLEAPDRVNELLLDFLPS